MQEIELRRVFKYINFLDVGVAYELYADLSLYNINTSEELHFKTYEELLSHKIGDNTLSDLLDGIKIEFIYSGGRGG